MQILQKIFQFIVFMKSEWLLNLQKKIENVDLTAPLV